MDQQRKNDLWELILEWGEGKSDAGTCTARIEAILAEHHHLNAFQAYIDRIAELKRALELPIMFHQGGPWSDRDQARWQEICDSTEATSKAMNDHIRNVLKKF